MYVLVRGINRVHFYKKEGRGKKPAHEARIELTMVCLFRLSCSTQKSTLNDICDKSQTSADIWL